MKQFSYFLLLFFIINYINSEIICENLGIDSCNGSPREGYKCEIITTGTGNCAVKECKEVQIACCT